MSLGGLPQAFDHLNQDGRKSIVNWPRFYPRKNMSALADPRRRALHFPDGRWGIYKGLQTSVSPAQDARARRHRQLYRVDAATVAQASHITTIELTL